MASLFGKLKGSSSVPATPLAGASPSKKGAANTPSTPLEKWLAEINPSKDEGANKFFGMHNASNTCYCNSVVQCLYFSEPFREQIINFPRRGPKHSTTENDSSNARSGNESKDSSTGMSAESSNGQRTQDQASDAVLPKKGTPTPTASSTNQPENKESFDYQKKLALMAGPHIRMEKEYSQTYGMSESLFTSLKDLFEAIINFESRTGIVTPTKILEVLKRNNEMFRLNIHQDAHEFLILLLADVAEQVENYIKERPEAANSSTGLGLTAPSLQSQSTHNAKPTSSWVHDLLQSTLTSETRCLTCENVSQRDEVYLDISIDLEEHSSVTSCLSKFSAEEMLCERNKFHCDTCSGLQEAEKRMKIKRLPKILALHLKRFKYTQDGTSMKKLFHRVNYPFHLRLLNTTDDAEDADRLYELYAVVVHLGSSPFHGHYVSIVKSKDRGWLLFDDELVLPVEKEYVRNFFGGDPKNPACAYVLFYQETTIEAVQREQETEAELASPSMAASTDLAGGTGGADDEPTSPIINPETAQVPATEDIDSLANLNQIFSAPATSKAPAQDNETSGVGLGLDRAPSADEPRTVSPTLKSPGSTSKSGHFNRLKTSGLSLRGKSKLWSGKDKPQDPAMEEQAQDDSELSRETTTTATSLLEKPEKEKTKTGRFSLGKKKTSG